MTDPGPSRDLDPARAGYVAIILAGGTGARLGGRDKARLVVEGRTLLDRALELVADADQVVVSGTPQPGEAARADLQWVLEDPPLGGPVAGVLAALAALSSTSPIRKPVLVVAVDMPGLSRDTVQRLLTAAQGRAGAVLTSDDGRRHLAAVLDAATLLAQAPSGTGHGLAWRALLAPLALVEVAASATESHDLDTPADLGRDLPPSGGSTNLGL